MEFGESAVEQLDSLGRGHGSAVEIAGAQNGVDTLLAGDLHDAVHGCSLLVEQRSPMEQPAEMPVGGVQEPHADTVGTGCDSFGDGRGSAPVQVSGTFLRATVASAAMIEECTR